MPATTELGPKSRKPSPGRGAKPGERRGGRQKGTPNKVTGDVREMVLAALSNAGGVQYLTDQAASNPGAFLTLVGKCLPKEITGLGGADLMPSVIRIELVEPK